MSIARPKLDVLLTLTAILIALAGLSSTAGAQSSDQSFPTPVKINEISGTIRARDIGDPRLTTYFYTFEATQGDLFLNVQTTDFTGDIDVYTMPGLHPLTKIVIYADTSLTETGRVIYLRKPETLVLRIQGRTPGDNAAKFQMKFAGSFQASKLDEESVPDMPTAVAENKSGIIVNSVGTIVGRLDQQKKGSHDPSVSEPAENERTAKSDAASGEPSAAVPSKASSDDDADKEKDVPVVSAKPEVILTDPLNAAPAETEKPAPKPARRTGRSAKAVTPPPKARTTAATRRKAAQAEAELKAKERKAAEESRPDPMANVRLVIYFKDGSTIDRPMTDVFKFSVERAVLTVINKDGSIGRYQMIDVARVSIE